MSPARLPKLAVAACLALPLGAVVTVRSLATGAGPARASAAAPAQTPGQSPGQSPGQASGQTPVGPALSVREPNDPPELLAEVRALLVGPAGSTVVAAPQNRIELKTAPAVQPPARVRPAFSLSSISRGARQNIAVVDGKLRRPGDDLGEGWSIASIDAASGEVRLSGPDGETMTLSIRKDR